MRVPVVALRVRSLLAPADDDLFASWHQSLGEQLTLLLSSHDLDNRSEARCLHGVLPCPLMSPVFEDGGCVHLPVPSV